MNVALYCYEGTTRYALDLYEAEPIKMTISAEEILDPTKITSSFSRQFRIPATAANSRFFKYWYVAGTIDFDIRVIVRSEIHVDGILYRTGQLRLQAAYVNQVSDNVDLEVVFLGETKDFSSQIGEDYMTSLDLTDTAHLLTKQNIEYSWLLPTAPNSLFDGAIRYIIADRGYEYNEDGDQLPVPNQVVPSEIVFNQADHPYSFERRQHALDPLQFTPIVQIKYLIDKIFARTTYTYSDDSIFNEFWFQNLYIDGIGSSIGYTPQSDGRFYTELYNWQPAISAVPIPFETMLLNNSSAFNTLTHKYTALADGDYTFSFSTLSTIRNSDGSALSTEIRLMKNGVAIYSDIETEPSGGIQTSIFSHTGTYTLTAGNSIWLEFVFTGVVTGGPSTTVNEAIFEATATPSQVATNDLMKPELTQIDLLRSILTKFRCVMVPNTQDSTVFTVKTWNDYIASGNNFDWTTKLDYSKDIKIEPLFFEQPRLIEFTDVEDVDPINTYHQDTFGTIYGRRIFNSANDLLSDRNTIDTVFAPTPVTQVEEGPANFIIPMLYELAEDQTAHGGVSHPQHKPIVPEPRLLYWNGMRTTGTGGTWYYGDQTTGGSTAMTTYPCASYLTAIPSTTTTLNLNWRKEFAYFSQVPGGPVGDLGTDVYTEYWEPYITNTYSPEARKITAYFNLDSEDLRNLTFDDVIFIKDSYWRLYKLFDAPLGEVATIKVELIKILV